MGVRMPSIVLVMTIWVSGSLGLTVTHSPSGGESFMYYYQLPSSFSKVEVNFLRKLRHSGPSGLEEIHENSSKSSEDDGSVQNKFLGYSFQNFYHPMKSSPQLNLKSGRRIEESVLPTYSIGKNYDGLSQDGSNNDANNDKESLNYDHNLENKLSTKEGRSHEPEEAHPEGNHLYQTLSYPLSRSFEDEKKKKEVHYHKHEHIHEHDHLQDHVHDHQQKHLHDHNHGHKHLQHHKHQHKHGHQHDHKSEHKHGHKHDHSHKHENHHKHEHEQKHHHGHDHKHKHDHHQDHEHKHDHHNYHKHSHHQDHDHKHHHGHKHEAHHKHGHHGDHKHGHEHKHQHVKYHHYKHHG